MSDSFAASIFNDAATDRRIRTDSNELFKYVSTPPFSAERVPFPTEKNSFAVQHRAGVASITTAVNLEKRARFARFDDKFNEGGVAPNDAIPQPSWPINPVEARPSDVSHPIGQNPGRIAEYAGILPRGTADPTPALPTQHFASAWFLEQETYNPRANPTVPPTHTLMPPPICTGPFVLSLIPDVEGNACMRIVIACEYEAAIQIRETNTSTETKYIGVDTGLVLVANERHPWAVAEFSELYIVMISAGSLDSGRSDRVLYINRGTLALVYEGDSRGIIRPGQKIGNDIFVNFSRFTGLALGRQLRTIGVTSRRVFEKVWQLTDEVVPRIPLSLPLVVDIIGEVPTTTLRLPIGALNDYLHLTEAAADPTLKYFLITKYAGGTPPDTTPSGDPLSDSNLLNDRLSVKTLDTLEVTYSLTNVTKVSFGGPLAFVGITDFEAGETITPITPIDFTIFAGKNVENATINAKESAIFALHIQVSFNDLFTAAHLRIETYNIWNGTSSDVAPVLPLALSQGGATVPNWDPIILHAAPAVRPQYIISYPTTGVYGSSKDGFVSPITQQFCGVKRIKHDFIGSTPDKLIVNFRVANADYVIASPSGSINERFAAFWDPHFGSKAPDIITVGRPSGYNLVRFRPSITNNEYVYQRLSIRTISSASLTRSMYEKPDIVTDIDVIEIKNTLNSIFCDQTTQTAIDIWYGELTYNHPSTIWTASRTYHSGAVVHPITPPMYASGTQFLLYRATFSTPSITSGTSSATEPMWPIVAGGTVIDSDITWIAFAPTADKMPKQRLVGDMISWGRRAYRYARLIEMAARGNAAVTPIANNATETENVRATVKDAATKLWIGVRKIIDDGIIARNVTAEKITNNTLMTGDIQSMDVIFPSVLNGVQVSPPENTFHIEYRKWQKLAYDRAMCKYPRSARSVWGGYTHTLGYEMRRWCALVEDSVANPPMLVSENWPDVVDLPTPADDLHFRQLHSYPENDINFVDEHGEDFSFFDKHNVVFGYILYATFVALRYSGADSTENVVPREVIKYLTSPGTVIGDCNEENVEPFPLFQMLLDYISPASTFEAYSARTSSISGGGGGGSNISSDGRGIEAPIGIDGARRVFPPHRHFDAYAGHSFSDGIIPGRVGNASQECVGEAILSYFAAFRFLTEVSSKYSTSVLSSFVGPLYTNIDTFLHPYMAYATLVSEMVSMETLYRPSHASFSTASSTALKMTKMTGGVGGYGSKGFPIAASEKVLDALYADHITSVSRLGTRRGTEFTYGSSDDARRFSSAPSSVAAFSVAASSIPVTEPLALITQLGGGWDLRAQTSLFGGSFIRTGVTLAGWLDEILALSSSTTIPPEVRAWARALAIVINYIPSNSTPAATNIVFPKELLDTQHENYLPQSGWHDVKFWFKLMTNKELTPDVADPNPLP